MDLLNWSHLGLWGLLTTQLSTLDLNFGFQLCHFVEFQHLFKNCLFCFVSYLTVLFDFFTNIKNLDVLKCKYKMDAINLENVRIGLMMSIGLFIKHLYVPMFCGIFSYTNDVIMLFLIQLTFGTIGCYKYQHFIVYETA